MLSRAQLSPSALQGDLQRTIQRPLQHCLEPIESFRCGFQAPLPKYKFCCVKGDKGSHSGFPKESLSLSSPFSQIQNHIIEAARSEGIQESLDSMFAYLIERVRNNLHVVLCMSPVGDPFR